jgi:hypothetical protein
VFAFLDFLSKFLHFLSIYAVASKEHFETRLKSLSAFENDRLSAFEVDLSIAGQCRRLLSNADFRPNV